MHRCPGIYLTAEENIGKPQLGDRLMKAVRVIIPSIGVPYLEMAPEVSRHGGTRRRRRGKERIGRVRHILHSGIRNMIYSLYLYGSPVFNIICI